MEAWLVGDQAEAGDEEDEEGGEAPAASKARAPEKKRRKLLERTTWERDRGLMDAARRLAQELGEDPFDDYNDFLALVDRATKKCPGGVFSPRREEADLPRDELARGGRAAGSEEGPRQRDRPGPATRAV